MDNYKSVLVNGVLTRYDNVTLEGMDDSGNIPVIGPLGGTLQTQTVIAQNGTPTRKTFDPPIKGMSVEIRSGAADDAETFESLVLCIGASNTTVAAGWLTETNTAPRITMKVLDGIQWFYFNGALVSYVDIKAIGTALNLDVALGGIS